ncbi:MAG: NADH-quinone oxidoreductase subunit [Frankiales bacterium]|nr:NADH-quinone oxidoreductase subunit [Frankiales bacterium]
MTSPAQPALVLTGARSYRLTVLNVGLACCAVEAVVAALGGSAVPGTLPLADPSEPVDVLLVSGTVTDRLAPLVRRLYDSLPGPVRVVSFGACANSGGPYWDSYSVTNGVHLVVPVDVWVPGCPPRPEALLAALGDLAAAPADRPLQEPVSARVTGPSDLRARALPDGAG